MEPDGRIGLEVERSAVCSDHRLAQEVSSSVLGVFLLPIQGVRRRDALHYGIAGQMEARA
jgi:hypothetical protein